MPLNSDPGLVAPHLQISMRNAVDSPLRAGSIKIFCTINMFPQHPCTSYRLILVHKCIVYCILVAAYFVPVVIVEQHQIKSSRMQHTHLLRT